MRDDLSEEGAARGRRLWPVFVAPILVIALAIGWALFWFIASSRIADDIEAWRLREAKGGRNYTCAGQEIGGFPFRFELRCEGFGATITSISPNAIVAAHSFLAVAQVYDPTLLILELTGPARVSSSDPVSYQAQWSLAQASVRGTPREPQRVSIAVDAPQIDELRAGTANALFKATRAELHGRVVEGSVKDHPVIEIASRLEGASAPLFHVLTVQPFNSQSVMVLKGLRDFSPKPWSERFREIQSEGGALTIRQARFEQGEVLGVAAGTLRLTESGHLDGQMEATIAGLDKLLPALGLDKLMKEGVTQDEVNRVAPGIDARQINEAIGALDRLLPGLGEAARKHVNQGIAAGVAIIGKPAELEGRAAQRVTLRLRDGDLFFGPVKLGQTPRLF